MIYIKEFMIGSDDIYRMYRSDLKKAKAAHLRGIKFRDLSFAQQFEVVGLFSSVTNVPDYYYAWSRSPLAYTKYHMREKFQEEFSQTRQNILAEWRSREAALHWSQWHNYISPSKWLVPLLPLNPLVVKYRNRFAIKAKFYLT